MTLETTKMTDSGQGDSSLEIRIATACNQTLATEDLSPDKLVANLQQQIPELTLNHVMTRTGWHRLGGVVDADYQRIAHHIGEWVEAQSEGDISLLLDKCAEIHGFVTRLEGCTHYITAVTGEQAKDFVQIEIEQVQEVIERPLWDPDWMPDDLEEFIDPLDFPHLEPEPIGVPRLLFRRLIRVADYLNSEDAGAKIKRFLGDWDRSSASKTAKFCHHWCLSIREYQDTQGDLHLSAKPIAVPSKDQPELPDDVATSGATLAKLIHQFDRHRGYPFAWYFHMLTQRNVSYGLAETVYTDLMGDFDYLPERDLIVLSDWHRTPYSV